MSLEMKLNELLSNLVVLNTKFYHYHWNVKGGHFFTLHEKYEELYTEGHAYIDEVAERILMIGGTPVSTLKGYLSLTSLLEEARTDLDATTMVKQTLFDLGTMRDTLKQVIASASYQEDKVTEDMAIGMLASYEKTIWMLKAFLKK